MKLIGTLSLICLVMAIAAKAQDEDNRILDTTGQPLERDVDYYIKPAITDNGGRFALVPGTEWCQLYPGQENNDSAPGDPVRFEPFAAEENVVRESRDLKITFFIYDICMRSKTWELHSERDPKSGRRRIGTGSSGEATNYFRIHREIEGVYSIQWCPTEVCPLCRFDCGSVGPLVKDGKRFLALDGFVLPVVFERGQA
jgi:hypothetical protein